MSKNFKVTTKDLERGRKNLQITLPISEVNAVCKLSRDWGVPVSTFIGMVIRKHLENTEGRLNKKDKSLYNHTIDMFDK